MRSYQDLNNNIHSPTVEPLDEDWGDDDVFQSELEVKLSADFCTSHKLAEISITDCNESEAELVQLQLKSDEVDRQLTVLHEVVDRLLISRFRTKDPVEKFAYRNIASRLDLHGKLQWVAKRLKSTLNTSYQRIIEETIKEFEDVRRDISQLQIKHEAELKATAEESLDAEDKKVELNKQINSFAHRFACISSKLKSIELFTAEINAKNDQILADRDQIDQLIKSNISENFIKLDDVAPLESSILAMENRLKLMKLANFDSLEQLNAQRQCLIALENRLEELMLEEKQSGLKQKVELSHQLTIAKLRLSEKLRQLQSLNDDLKTEQIIGHLDCLDRQSRDQFDNQRKAYEGLESESSQLYSELRRISVDLEDLRKRNEPNASVEHLQNDNLSAQHEESDIMPVSKAITTMDATTNTEENVLGDSLLLTLAQLKAEVRQNKLTSLKRQLIIRQALMTTKCRMNMEKKTMLKEMREKSAFLLISMASLLEGQRKLNPKKIDQITKAAKQYF